WRFHLAIGELGDFEFRGDGLGDPDEFACGLKGVEEITEGIESHGRTVAKRAKVAIFGWRLRRPSCVERCNVGTIYTVGRRFRPLVRGRGRRSAASLPWRRVILTRNA